jgi:hypothetical protein
MKYYIIVDWANNRLFPNKRFKSFENAWHFLLLQFKDDSELQDIYVVKEN